MKKINKLRINTALLATLILTNPGLSLAKDNNEQTLETQYNIEEQKKNDRIERLFLTAEEKKNPNYSYIIIDSVEDILTENGVKIYNTIIEGIMDRRVCVRLNGDKKEIADALKGIKYSPYDIFLDNGSTIDYSTKTLKYKYRYTMEEQVNKINFIQEKMKELKENLFEDDMNVLDKITMLFNYTNKNFDFYEQYPQKEDFGSNKKALIYGLDSLFEEKKGVCHTFAMLLDTIFQEEGIPSYLQLGRQKNVRHIWNYIRLDDNEYYMFDLTNTLTYGKLINNIFEGYGVSSKEFKSNKYEINDNEKIDYLEINQKGLKDVRYFYSCEYLGNHTFKLTGNGYRTLYFNTETRELTKEEIKTQKK